MASLTFVVPGQPETLDRRGSMRSEPAAPKGILKHSVRVAAARAEGASTRVTATPGTDVVVFHIQDGPSLVLHPEHARDLMLAQKGVPAARAGVPGARATEADEIHVPASLGWRLVEQAAATRGGPARSRFGEVLLKGVEVLADAAQEFAADFLIGKATSFAASSLVGRIDGQVDEGVYRLDRNVLPPLKAAARKVAALDTAGGAALVLVHGAFSSTAGTFSRLWTRHPALVERLFARYRGCVFGLDHRTLGVSPISNALTLVRTVPAGARLHLVAHSRGGLVGDVLARACSRNEAGLEAFEGDEYRVHRDELDELIDEARSREIQVERLVRVACPARGTLLASKRLDAYLSMLRWSMEIGGVPIVPEIVDFLNGVAQYRTDPTRIPGLAALIPDSPLMRWLHDVAEPVPGDLRVVAGDLAGDSIMSWLKTLLADGFYWTDNDLIVQTRSMYGGTPRDGTSTFVLDRGGGVSHFAYFSNARTAAAIVGAVLERTPASFQPIGPLSYAGQDASGVRAARATRTRQETARPDLPAVIIVPGIFGSHLADEQGRVRLDGSTSNLRRRLGTNGTTAGAEGLVGELYAGLSGFLSETHDVTELAYDWRQPIRRSAEQLRRALAEALEPRGATGQPVRVLSHSSGGLVVRALQLVDGELWTRWLSHAAARILMLGPPNAGFWMPMQVLSGDDTLGGLLPFAGPPFGEQDVRQMLAECPGCIDLQAGLLDDPDRLGRASWWRTLADEDVRRVTDSTTWHTDALQRRTVEWGVPRQEHLDAARRLHEELDAQRGGALAAVSDRIAIVAGSGVATPSGYDTAADGLQYVYDGPGDGYVTHRSASLPGCRMWVMTCGHSMLPATPGAFAAYLELLQHGQTSRLSVPDVRRAREDELLTVVRARPARTPGAGSVPVTGEPVLGGAAPDETTAEAARLRVSVVNGDVTFVSEPLLLGHYRSSTLTGAERVVDSLIGNTMLTALHKGQYPDSAGSRQVFVNTRAAPDDPRQVPRPEAVVVVGLGEEGSLQPAQLVHTVKHGVIAWAQRLAERATVPPTFDVAATLIGSGGIGMTVGQAAQLIVRGVCEANETLAGGDGELEAGGDRVWPYVAHLTLIELYLDRATEAWRALRVIAGSDDAEYVLDETVESASGALRRPLDSSYRGADYDFIRAATHDGPDGPSIAYTLDTKRARTETRTQQAQKRLLESLIGDAAHDRSWDLAVRRTLFRLLVPVDLEPFLTGDTETQLEVDSGTAGIPWELLDDSGAEQTGALPWAIRTKLLRKLRTTEYRTQVADAGADACALVIGDPECDRKYYPALIGARQEAAAVGEALVGSGGLHPDRVVTLTSTGGETPEGPNARAVFNALMARDWRIVHIAGHGELATSMASGEATPGTPTGSGDDLGGVVLSNGVFLSPREIASIRRTPELVFVNCCYLAARDPRQILTDEWLDCERRRQSGRTGFAAGVADALIRSGVRCVIAAGWAVDDGPAAEFARTFYRRLLDGDRFIDAVASARLAAWQRGGNTWAAYQCYGDPYWVFRRGVSDAQRPAAAVSDPDATIASARDLTLTLQTIAVECEFQRANKDEARDRIARLDERFRTRWGHEGRVAESFAEAYAKAGGEDRAIEWYRTSIGAEDGRASTRAAEQLENLQVRRAWNGVGRARADLETLQRTGAPPTQVSAAERALAAAVADATRIIGASIERLEMLVAIGMSMERASLIGSACKRLALIADIAGDAAGETAALESMKEWYRRAEDHGREKKIAGFYYPALNRVAAELALGAGPVPLDARMVEEIRADLDALVSRTPDFWNVASQAELRLYESLSRGALAGAVDGIIASLADLNRRIGQEWMWSSLHDQATFTLGKYARRATAEEKSAARRLLEYLAGLSGRS